VKITVVMTAVGIVAGFLAGYWVALESSETEEPKLLSEVRMPETIGFRNDSPYQLKYPQAGTDAPVRVVAKAQMQDKRDFKDVAACTREVERLNAAMEHLVAENIAHKKEMKYEVGEPVPFPPDLDPKFLEPALMKNLNKAFEEVGLDGDVSFVDCDEFPCIVCAGLGLPEDEEMGMNESMEKIKKLKDSQAMETYDDAQTRSSVMVRHEENDAGVTRTLNNCQAIYPAPEDEALRQALQKRLMWRMNKLNETM
jgi:hypothetical protein